MLSSVRQEFPQFSLGEDLILREIISKDAESFLDYFSNPLVNRYILMSPPRNLPEAKEEVRYWQELYYNNHGIYWSIARVSDNQSIGSIGFNDRNPFHSRLEISYDLHKDYWGYGIMSYAISQVLPFAFSHFKINRIQAFCLPFNHGSKRVLEKNNFECEGNLKQYRYFKGKYHDVLIYSLLRNNYYKHFEF